MVALLLSDNSDSSTRNLIYYYYYASVNKRFSDLFGTDPLRTFLSQVRSGGFVVAGVAEEAAVEADVVAEAEAAVAAAAPRGSN